MTHKKLLFIGVLFVLANVALAVMPVFIGLLTDALSIEPVNQSYAWLMA